jgi:hypothetical protein
MADPGSTVWHLSNEVQNLWGIINEDPALLNGDLDELRIIWLSLKAALATVDAFNQR